MKTETLYEICLKRQREALDIAKKFDNAILRGTSAEQKEHLAKLTKEKLLIALQDLDMAYHPNHFEILDKYKLNSELERVNLFLGI